MTDTWFWCQDGKTLEAVVMTDTKLATTSATPDGGPFVSRHEALNDALAEYEKTVRLYRKAIITLKSEVAFHKPT